MTLIGLMGFAQAGKDETARVLIAHNAFERVAFADTLRDMAYALDPVIEVSGFEQAQIGGTPWDPDGWDSSTYRAYVRLTALVDAIGWNGAKQIDDVRRTLQRLGTEAGREILGQDIWVDTAFNQKVIPFLNEGTSVVITDMRFPNEVRAVRNHGGFVWRVDRPGIVALNTHASEHAWTKVKPDHVIINDGSLGDLAVLVTDVLRATERLAA